MKIESIVLAGGMMLAGLAQQGSAQIVLGGPDVVLLGQSGQIAPMPPLPPMAPMQDVIRLMASSGSYLGVGVRDVDADRKKALGLKEERGAEITSVQEDSPASKAGLKMGDVVLDYGGQRVESMEQFIRMVRETPAGREIKIGVSRGGTLTSVMAKPEGGRNQHQVARTIRVGPMNAPMPNVSVQAWPMDSPRTVMYWKNGSLGVEAESLDNQLADFFGVKEGVLVRSVGKGTAADKAGVKAGDVIVKVDETKVSSPREITSAVRTARNGTKTINLSVVREKKENVLKVTFEDELPTEAPMPRTRSIQTKPLED